MVDIRRYLKFVLIVVLLVVAMGVASTPTHAASLSCSPFDGWSYVGLYSLSGGQNGVQTVEGEKLIFTLTPTAIAPATQVYVSFNGGASTLYSIPTVISFDLYPRTSWSIAITAVGGGPLKFDFTTKCTATTGGACVFTDGRLNCHDAGQTAAIYCKADGSVEVMAIFNGKGYPAFTATAAEIAKVPAKPAKNTLIKQGNGAFLYRLKGGLLQVNRAEDGTGKIYSFRFSCP